MTPCNGRSTSIRDDLVANGQGVFRSSSDREASRLNRLSSAPLCARCCAHAHGMQCVLLLTSKSGIRCCNRQPGASGPVHRGDGEFATCPADAQMQRRQAGRQEAPATGWTLTGEPALDPQFNLQALRPCHSPVGEQAEVVNSQIAATLVGELNLSERSMRRIRLCLRRSHRVDCHVALRTPCATLSARYVMPCSPEGRRKRPH